MSQILTIDKNASEQGEEDVPAEAGVVNGFAMAGFDWAPGVGLIAVVLGNIVRCNDLITYQLATTSS